MTRQRCGWCTDDPVYIDYHDKEWGVPVHDDTRLFEMLVLEGAQAGLSWLTILKRRENYRAAFRGFDVEKVAAFGEQETRLLLQDEGIIRNRLKITAAIKNGRAAIGIIEKYGSLDKFLWQFTGGGPIRNCWENIKEVPASTPESEIMSRELKKCGFTFVGPTICYAFMQATGMVNDHTTDCFRYQEIEGS